MGKHKGKSVSFTRKANYNAVIKKKPNYLSNELKSLSSKGPEAHFHTFEYPADYIGQTGSVECVNLIEVGDLETTRIGNQIEANYLRVTGSFAGGDSPPNILVRMIIFVDKICDGNLPTLQELLNNRDDAKTDDLDIYQQVKYDNRHRFIILKDKTWALDNSAKKNFFFDKFINLKKMNIYYKGATVNMEDAGQNSVFIAFLSNTNSANETPTLRYVARLKFEDK